MAIKPIPHPSVPLTDSQGNVTPAWYQYFQSRETFRPNLADLADVQLTVLANGEVLIWNSATGKYENGAN